jgi:hypothetical protein
MLRVSCVPAVLASATGQLGRAVLGLVAGEHMEIASRRVITSARAGQHAESWFGDNPFALSPRLARSSEPPGRRWAPPRQALGGS